jgi:two-component system, OmpR family, phosphate regulon response regulator PhoB
MVNQAYAPLLTAAPAAQQHVLVVDDDESVRLLATEALSAEGYDVVEAHNGATAIQMIRGGNVDAVVLDLGLPEISGLDVLTSVRDVSDVPILILSGRSDEGDVIQGLRLGADDYMVKPCSPRELAARVKTVLRRTGSPAPPTGLDFDGLQVDLAAHEVAVDGRAVELTPLEFELLVCLARSPRIVVTRAQLLECVWDSSAEWQTTATVTEHVRRLRAKIEVTPQDPRWIVTVRGLGYRFEPR